MLCILYFTSILIEYSGTSHNGPYKKWTASIQRTNYVSPNDFAICIELIQFQPLRYGQRTRILAPNDSTWPVQK